MIRFGPVVCEGCGATYPVAEGILDFLAGEAGAKRASLANRALEKPMVARLYERGLRPLLARFPMDPEGEVLLLRSLLELQGPEAVLDLSCGTGHLARALARDHEGPFIGLDSSVAMLHEARHHVEETGERIDLLRGDAHALPFRSGSLGAVLNAASFHLYERPLQVLEEVVRVLAPGGRFVCTTVLPARPKSLDRLESRAGIHRKDEEEMRHLFELAGFRTFERILLPRWIVARGIR